MVDFDLDHSFSWFRCAEVEVECCPVPRLQGE